MPTPPTTISWSNVDLIRQIEAEQKIRGESTTGGMAQILIRERLR